SAVTISTTSPSSSSHTRSRSIPLTTPMTAALARRRPIDDARPPTVVPAGTLRREPSGSVMSISAISRAYAGTSVGPNPKTGVSGDLATHRFREDLGRGSPGGCYERVDVLAVTHVGLGPGCGSGRRGSGGTDD